MRNSRAILVLSLSLLGLSNYAFAVCNAGSNCELPLTNGTAGSWTASASGMTGIQNFNSVGPTGNDVGSRYYYAASSTDQGATVSNGSLSTTGDGSEVIGSFALNSNSSPTSVVFGGVVQSLLGNQSYTIYVQACPSGALPDTARCSQWARIGTKSTLPYPTNVFLTPVRPADTTIDSIFARASVPASDVNNISQLQFEVDNLITGGLNQTGILMAWIGNGSYEIDSSLYTAGGGFKPNVKYLFKGQVYYPYGVAVPTAGAETETNLWTTPKNPGTVTTANITHCSVQITALNSSGVPANPNYTTYNLCAVGTAGACATDLVSGATPADIAQNTITGLNPGTNYTPQATALVGNGDSTSTGWNDSGTTSGAGFTTLPWGGTFTVTAVGVTSATFNISGLTGASSIATWAIKTGGSGGTTLASGSGDPTGSHDVTGLTPNTVYGNLVIVLTETSGCSSTLSFTPASITTTPLPPTVPASFSSVLATSLQVNWTNAPANSAGTQYRAELCTDPGYTTCQNSTTTSAFTTFTVSPVTTYYARVKAVNRTGAPWQDSGYLVVGSVTTPPNQSAITVTPNPATGVDSAVTGTPKTFTATVTDQTGAVIPGQQVNWHYSGGDAQLSTTHAAATDLTATIGGNFTLTASLGGVYADVNVPVHVNDAGPAITGTPTITLNPDDVSANLSCLASDPGYPEAALTYTWSLVSGPGGAVSFSINGTNAAKNSVVTFSQAGTYTFRCTAKDPATMTGSGTTAPTLRSSVLRALAVTPSNITLSRLISQNFTAVGTDQFGGTMTPGSLSWTATGGSITGAGVFQSTTLGTGFRITATSIATGVSGSATVNIVNYDVSGSYASPVPYKSTSGVGAITFRGLGTSAKIRIYTVSGRQVFSTEVTNPAGEMYSWNVKNNSGENLASGVYLYVIESPTTTKHGKLIIIQ